MSQLTEDADVEKHASAATLAELEDTIRQLKRDVAKMASNIKKKDETISNDNSKIEHLQLSLTIAQRELDNALIEAEKERYSRAVMDEQFQALDCKKSTLAGEVTQMKSVVAEKNEALEQLEIKLRVQVADYELKIKTSEEDFNRMRNEARQKHRKEVKALQMKMKDDQIKHMSQLNIYQKRVDHLEAEIAVLKSQGEDELRLLNSQLTGHEDEFKKLCLIYEKKLDDSERKHAELEKALASLKQNTRNMENDKNTEIGRLQQSLAHSLFAQKQLECDAAATYSAKAEMLEKEWSRKLEEEKEGAEVAIQKLNEMHATALEMAFYNHEIECTRLKKELEQEKSQEVQASKESSSKEIERLQAELKQAQQTLNSEREEHSQQQSALVSAHQHALEGEMKKAETEISQLKEHHGRELSIAVSRSTEKVVMESLTLHEDHKKKLERLSEAHNADLQKLKEAHLKEIEKLKSNNAQALSRIAELENVITFKEKKMKELSDAAGELESQNESSVKELKLSHEKAFNFQRSKFCKDKEVMAKQLEMKYRTDLDACNEFHTRQYQTLQQDLNRSKMLMRQKQSEITSLQSELGTMKDRYENRQSRPEDLQNIASLEQQFVALQQAYESKEAALVKLEGETKQLRMEMHNREENYNRIFRSSPVVQPTFMELKPRSPSRSAQGSRSESRQGNLESRQGQESRQGNRINFP